MSIRITDHTLTETIRFIIDSHQRRLKQVITDLQDPCHADFKKFNVCRPRLAAIYSEADAQLHGIHLITLDHKQVGSMIKNAKKELHAEWQLHDFQIVALQRPGAKPPFYIPDAA